MPVYDPFNPDTEQANVAPEQNVQTAPVYDPFAAKSPQESPGILSSTWNRMSETYNRPFAGDEQHYWLGKSPLTRAIGFGPQGGTPLQLTGDVASGINKAVGGLTGWTAQKLYNLSVPPQTQELISAGAKKVGTSILDTSIGKMGLSAIQKGVDYWNLFSQTYPEAARDISASLNLTAAAPTAYGVSKVVPKLKSAATFTGREFSDIAKDVSASMMKPKVTDDIEKLSNGIIDHGVNKTFLNRTAKNPKAWIGDSQTAMKAIVDNPNDFLTLDEGTNKLKPMFQDEVSGKFGYLPRNLEQTADAVDIAMKRTFKRYDGILNSLGDKAPNLDNTSLIQALEGKINPDTGKLEGGLLQKVQKQGIAQAGNDERKILKTIAQLKQRNQPKNLSTIQDEIKVLNDALMGFETKDSNIAQMYLLQVKALRKDIERAIDDISKSSDPTSQLGKEYTQLKKQYGALRAIDKNVVRAYMKARGKSGDYVTDLTDVVSGSMMAKAVMAGKPSLAGAALAGREIAKIKKILKDPDRAIRKMFDELAVVRGKRQAQSKLATGYKEITDFAPEDNPLTGLSNQSLVNPQFNYTPTMADIPEYYKPGYNNPSKANLPNYLLDLARKYDLPGGSE